MSILLEGVEVVARLSQQAIEIEKFPRCPAQDRTEAKQG